MRTSIARLIGGGLALTLLVAACGDDNDDDAATTEEAGDRSAASDDAMTAESGETSGSGDMSTAGDDIVDTAVAAGEFETLVTAVQAAGLEETLRGDGPYTVFAPSDAAFQSLPDGTVESLLADPEGDLTDVLTYHVVEGEVLAEDVAGLDGQEVTTVNGATFTVDAGEDGSVTLRDAAGNDIGVTQTDIETSNGVIHVIDTVLLPG
jgi:uncharacterized surface protein with fasciclin (FAS1) repeats